MAKIDPEQERRRLAEFYARQLDGELEKVAGEAYDLSDVARELLKTELQKRGLSTTLAEQPPVTVRKPPETRNPPQPNPWDAELQEPKITSASENAHEGEIREGSDVVAVRKFRDLPEALLAKGSLESAGIECALADDNLVRMDWFYSNAIGGIRLLVSSEDAAEAEQILSQPIPEHLDVSGVGDVEQPKCPKCGSLDVNFRESAPVAYVTMMLANFPIPLHRRAWRCQTCDVEWEDDGLPETDSISS